ncbi:MAG: hypoxanthine phosphoribosyltransferase [Actinobacteria bacterium]|nr:hypoxanthine phosphoribosyltransferase [Actinomycetota bacterium]
MHQDIVKVLYSKEEIEAHVRKMGAQIAKDYQGEDLILVAVLRGAVMFLADLARAIDGPIEMDFMAVSSYGSSAKSSGVVRIIKDLDTDIKGRNVLIAEDIVDSGLTLKYLLKNLASRQPKSLEVASLLIKEGVQQVNIDCKYPGLVVPNEFVVGYGLDYGERYRNLPYVGILDSTVYKK